MSLSLLASAILIAVLKMLSFPKGMSILLSFPQNVLKSYPIPSPEFLHKISPSISIFNLLDKQTVYTNAQYWHENNLYFSESIFSYKYNTAMYALYLQIHWHLFQKAMSHRTESQPFKGFPSVGTEALRICMHPES